MSMPFQFLHTHRLVHQGRQCSRKLASITEQVSRRPGLRGRIARTHIARQGCDAVPGHHRLQVVWAHFEQFSAVHNIPWRHRGERLRSLDAGTDPTFRRIWQNLPRLLDMSKEGTFHYTGRDGSGDGAFSAARSGMAFSSSALRG